MKISEYRTKYFAEGSHPSLTTIRKWVDIGEVYGEVINGHYYVDPDKMAPNIKVLVDKVLAEDDESISTKKDEEDGPIQAISKGHYEILMDIPNLGRKVLPPKK